MKQENKKSQKTKEEEELDSKALLKNENKVKKKAYIYNVGKRKTSIATVRLYKKGEGKVEINNLDIETYFPEVYLQKVIISPLDLVTQRKNVNVSVMVKGGGKKGQAESIRQGIAKALLELNPNFRKPLKKAGFLTRDARKKERKKYGLKGARRAPQWRKR